MIEYIAVLVFLLVLAGYIKLVHQPRKLYNHYLESLRQAGYKVYNMPFAPLGVPFFKLIRKDQSQGDALKICKTVYSQVDVVLANSFHMVVLDFCHPDFIKDFYSQEHLYSFPKVKIFTESITRVMGKGIPFSEGDEWKRKRRIINQVFNFDFVKSMTFKIADLCDKAIQDAEKATAIVEQNGVKTITYDIIQLMIRMFSSVVLECFLGGATNEQIQGMPIAIFVNKLSTDATMQGTEPLGFLFGVKFFNLGLRTKDRDINRRVRVFREWGVNYIKRKVADARQKIETKNLEAPSDIIEALLLANNNTQQQTYTEEEILEQFCTFFAAGTDTTSHYVMTMIYLIAMNPEVERKLRDEINTKMATEDYSYENLKKFTYIDWIQKQTSRFYGPVTTILLRAAKEDTVLNKLAIQKGTLIGLNHLGNHYSEKYFKNPHQFRPERWQHECDEIPPYVVGGFSAGARTCIGKHLVMIESKIGLIKFMQRYSRIELPVDKLRMVIKFVYTPEYFKSKMTINC